MALYQSSTIVTLEKSTAELGYAMNEIRSWLDSRRIQPVGLKTSLKKTGGVALEISFNTEDEAFLFVQKFRLNGRTPEAGAKAA
jgi:hypothetical protein